MSIAQSFYDQNINKEWSEWLEFETTFEKPGKQGLVGLMHLKEDHTVKYVFKISQIINYLVEHESLVMNGLKDIANWGPQFVNFIGVIDWGINPKNRKAGKRFDKDGKRKKKVLLCEY